MLNPQNMVSFGQQDLDEDVVITLVAKNPQAPKNKVRFDHTSGEFASVKVTESMFDQACSSTHFPKRHLKLLFFFKTCD